jgi:hypothetical protein
MRLLNRLLNAGVAPESYSVSAKLPDGWLTVANGNQEPAQTLFTAAAVVPASVLAGVTMPALAQARSRAESIQCVNNLKQIGLAVRIYAVDHGDTFPPDLLGLKQELVTPKVLVCPDDPKKPKLEALTWQDLAADAISYELLTPGLKDDGQYPGRTMVRCRVHGHVCRVDGSVQQNPSRR